jgi:hypothetical protein
MPTSKHPCLLLVLFVSCAPPAPAVGTNVGSSQRFNSELREVLLRLSAADQAVRREVVAAQRPSPEVIARMRALDLEHSARLERIIDRVGWPSPSLVGADGVQAAFIVLQHSQPLLQRRALPLLQAAHAKGALAGESLALLTDRVLVHQGKPQRYGTQAKTVDGVLVLEPLEDAAAVDARRAKLGLPPLEQYIRALERMYRQKVRR